jgi:hypothetical protein
MQLEINFLYVLYVGLYVLFIMYILHIHVTRGIQKSIVYGRFKGFLNGETDSTRFWIHTLPLERNSPTQDSIPLCLFTHLFILNVMFVILYCSILLHCIVQ